MAGAPSKRGGSSNEAIAERFDWSPLIFIAAAAAVMIGALAVNAPVDSVSQGRYDIVATFVIAIVVGVLLILWARLSETNKRLRELERRQR